MPVSLFLAQEIRHMRESFGGAAFADQTTLNPLAFVLVVLAGVSMLFLPRRYAVWPFIFIACFVSSAQRLAVASLDFQLLRLLVLFGGLRVLMKGDHIGLRWHRIDSLVIAFALVRTIAYTALNGSAEAFIFQAGQTFDAIGMYFLFRCFIRGTDEAFSVAIGFAWISVPVALFFAVEMATGRNVFAAFGGVQWITGVREGRLRCQGAFSHPIMAGCFWAATLPMIAALVCQRGMARQLGIIGVIAAFMIIVCCSSSTPVAAVMFGAIAASCFYVRWWMRPVRWGALVLLVSLHLIMKAPVWHLISRITISSGNDSHHRFLLIDGAINHFGEWCLIGTRSTAHWFWGAQDVTNQFVIEGVRGGALSLLLFAAIIWYSFAAIGKLWRAWTEDRASEMFAWSLGVALFVHCTSFIGVSYFGQTVVVWWLTLAMIASLASAVETSAESSTAAAVSDGPYAVAAGEFGRARHQGVS